jgi:hypothetical protein
MNTNKLFLLIAAVLFSGAFCAISAMADVGRPDAYVQLTHVELDTENAPKLINGMSELSSGEPRFQERLPIQLTGPMSHIARAKYKPFKYRGQ